MRGKHHKRVSISLVCALFVIGLQVAAPTSLAQESAVSWEDPVGDAATPAVDILWLDVTSFNGYMEIAIEVAALEHPSVSPAWQTRRAYITLGFERDGLDASEDYIGNIYLDPYKGLTGSISTYPSYSHTCNAQVEADEETSTFYVYFPTWCIGDEPSLGVRAEYFYDGNPDDNLWPSNQIDRAPDDGWTDLLSPGSFPIEAAELGGWTTLGGIINLAPSATSRVPGRMSVLARGGDGAAWMRERIDGTWAGWTSLGGQLKSDPSVAPRAGGNMTVYAVGTDRALWYRTYSLPNGGWLPWFFAGGIITSDPAAVGTFWGWDTHIFARGADNALWVLHDKTGNPGRVPWQSLGGILTSSPAAASWAPHHIEVFARGADNALWTRTFDRGVWSGWRTLGGIVSSDPAAVTWGPGHVEVYVRGADGALWRRAFTGAWGGWQSLGGQIVNNPAVASMEYETVDVFAPGADNALWTRPGL